MNDDKLEYLMIIDLLPSSKLDITKYLERHGIYAMSDFYKENRFRVKCDHDDLCGVLNEMVMMKDFKRDDELYFNYKLNKFNDKLHIFENSHISNLVYCRLSNKKLYKHYMKEFKTRRNHWNYQAIVIKKKDMAKNSKEEKLLKELVPVLRQSQINYTVLDKWKNLTHLRKDIMRQIEVIKNKIEVEGQVHVG